MSTLAPPEEQFLSRSSSNRSLKPPIKTESKGWRVAKILLPHIGIALFVMAYLLGGAAVFQRLEREPDWKQLEAKGRKIVAIYAAAADSVEARCRQNGRSVPEGWRLAFYHQLTKISSVHEKREIQLPEDLAPSELSPRHFVLPRWSFFESILYALSILTTTGYTRVNPATFRGVAFAFAYGLFGIPVMVLTAVDIGRFLSNACLFLYSRARGAILGFLRWLCCGPSSLGVRVRTKLLPASAEPNMADLVAEMKKTREERSWTPSEASQTPSDSRGENLPLVVNASVLLLFCFVGAVAYTYLFRKVGGPDYSESFFITFNLVANLTMGDIPLVEDIFILLFIVFFVWFGLAVLSMCAELAALELKWIFMKIHYFGRKITRRHRSRAEAVDNDLKELLKIIDEIRAKYPEKKKISPADILAYIHEIGALGYRCRYDTLAYIPDRMDGFKFADADEAETVAATRDGSSTPSLSSLHSADLSSHPSLSFL